MLPKPRSMMQQIHFPTKSIHAMPNEHQIMQYIVERHGNTLLPQYLGMYRLTVDGVQYYFVVMRNVFSSHLSIHR